MTMSPSMLNTAPEAVVALHIALAVVRDAEGRVLLARRPDDAHQGGLWEFPGGKVEAGESVTEALARELQEEVGIRPTVATPLIRICHRYPERTVLLDCWEVTAFEGQPQGLEGQPVLWESAQALDRYPFPAANRAIITAVQLPARFWITPDDSAEHLLSLLGGRVAAGIRLVRLRAPSLSLSARLKLARQMMAVLAPQGGWLLVDLELWSAGAGDFASGIQLNRHQLAEIDTDTLAALRLQGALWIGASCHDAKELAKAQSLACDLATLSPFRPTSSHPGAPVLEEQGVQPLLADARLPVYLLGGVGDHDRALARQLGAQGVAGIRQVGLAG